MIYGKEVRIYLKGQAKEAFLKLKKKDDKESQTILKSFERLKEILICIKYCRPQRL